jgi:putative hydrolase of the HAD superfamily
MLKAIGFDLDNTLYDQRDFEFFAFDKISEIVSSQYDISKNDYFKSLCELFYTEEKDKTFDKAMISINSKLPNGWDIFVKSKILPIYRSVRPKLKLNDYSKKLLELFYDNNFIMVLITNGNSQIQNYKIDSLGIRNYFNKIYISDDYGKDARKPNFKMFKMMLKDFHLLPEECIYVGDSKILDGACEKVGIKFLRICVIDKI